MCKPNSLSYVWIGGELIPIDTCIAPLVVQLNQFGIRTVHSCCGHGVGYPHVMCAAGTETLLEKFGCKIAVTGPDGLVDAYFPTVGQGGKVYPGNGTSNLKQCLQG